jgi:hypothetical protein
LTDLADEVRERILDTTCARDIHHPATHIPLFRDNKSLALERLIKERKEQVVDEPASAFTMPGSLPITPPRSQHDPRTPDRSNSSPQQTISSSVTENASGDEYINELKTVATYQAFFDIALYRLVDRVAIQIHHEFFLRFANDLQCTLRDELEFDGAEGLRKFIEYTTDTDRDKKRKELNQDLEVLKQARSKLHALPWRKD